MAKIQASDKRDSKIAFGLPPVGCLEQLVNNQYKADVVFKVGQSGELIYAHKLIITMASEVFFAQFNGGFAEAHRDTLTDPVVIDDIEPAPFLQLLRFMYCKEVDITAGNMLDISYASKKYMLRNLEVMCESSFVEHTNETTVLTVFQRNRRYGISAIDDLCLSIICENPLKFFKQDEFLALDIQALRLIASRSAMNCSIEQLDQAINRWKRSDGCKANVKTVVTLKDLLCRRLYFYDKGAYSFNIDTHLELHSTTITALYGIGIFVGVENDCPPTPNNTVTVRVDLNEIYIEEKVQITNKLKVHEIMFEKQVIKGRCNVSVQIVKQDCLKNYKMFHLNGVSTAGNSMFTIYNSDGSYVIVNCVAYFMTNLFASANQQHLVSNWHLSRTKSEVRFCKLGFQNRDNKL